jgi:3-oxoadipate enol-lactonase
MNLPIVFLHAFPLNATMWTDQAAVATGRTVLAPDFPGFGARPPGPSSLEGFADCVLAEMDAAGVRRAVFVGLSMGGYVAFRIHAKSPDRFAGLFLADTRAGPDDEAGRQRRTDQAERVRSEGIGWMADALIPGLLGETTRTIRPAVVARVRALVAGADPEGVARALLAMRDRPDSHPQLAQMDFPVVAAFGDEDALIPPAEAEAIVDAVPSGKLVRIPEAGLLSNLEEPARFNAALSTFLGKLERS